MQRYEENQSGNWENKKRTTKCKIEHAGMRSVQVAKCKAVLRRVSRYESVSLSSFDVGSVDH